MLAFDKICAVVAAPDVRSMRRQLRNALRYTRTAELRLDWLSSDAEIARFLDWLASEKPRATLIATCRRREAGGRYAGTIAQELLQLAEAIRAGCQWYDLEIESSSKCPSELIDVMLGEGRRIASAHFFRGMPPNLPRLAARLGAGSADVIKIAAQCDSLRAAVKLLSFARKHKKIIAIPMGDTAQPARFLALRDASLLAYAPVEPVAGATAPGQTGLADANEIYRAGHIDRRTRVYGVIGDPIGHSLSPVMHNAAFAARKMNSLFLPFLVRDLKDFAGAIAPLGIRGFSVTIPHKEAILKYLHWCDPLAEKIGAVNTVVVRPGGKLQGYNTDYLGVLRAMEPRMELAGSRVLILGAGGAARGVAFALARAGAKVYVAARRPRRAEAVAKAAGGEAVELASLARESFDAIVNATPVGMHPFIEESPLEARQLNCRLVFDTIYRPRKTKLLQLAERRKIETISGLEMFVAQGLAQWEIWTGQPAPREAMRAAVLRALARADKTNRAPRSREKRRSQR